jgi:hypothetical protein
MLHLCRLLMVTLPVLLVGCSPETNSSQSSTATATAAQTAQPLSGGVAGPGQLGRPRSQAATPDNSSTIIYQPTVSTDEEVDGKFKVERLEFGNAFNYYYQGGVINLLSFVVADAELTGYVKIEKAYNFAGGYMLILSTGENGASCPATTYVVSFDPNILKVTGAKQLEGCSEFVETMADGNKLIVKKDEVTSIFLNGGVN